MKNKENERTSSVGEKKILELPRLLYLIAWKASTAHFVVIATVIAAAVAPVIRAGRHEA